MLNVIGLSPCQQWLQRGQQVGRGGDETGVCFIAFWSVPQAIGPRDGNCAPTH